MTWLDVIELKGISYCPSTGVVSKYGKPVKAVNSNGYRTVRVGSKTIKCHRIAWYLTYGFWPKQIDHINRDKTDNRLINLRACTRSTNSLNRKTNSNNTSGVMGVSYCKSRNNWLVQYRSKTIGRYPTYQQAVEVRHGLDRRT